MRFNSTEITYNGVTYSSLAQLAKHFKLDKQSFYQRLKRGWTLEDAINKPFTARKKPEKIIKDLYYEWKPKS